MDKIFGPGYQGDPGVPHSGSAPFDAVIWGTLWTNLLTIWEPHYNQATNSINWHDLAMVCENQRLKRAKRRGNLTIPCGIILIIGHNGRLTITIGILGSLKFQSNYSLQLKHKGGR